MVSSESNLGSRHAMSGAFATNASVARVKFGLARSAALLASFGGDLPWSLGRELVGPRLAAHAGEVGDCDPFLHCCNTPRGRHASGRHPHNRPLFSLTLASSPPRIERSPMRRESEDQLATRVNVRSTRMRWARGESSHGHQHAGLEIDICGGEAVAVGHHLLHERQRGRMRVLHFADQRAEIAS